MTHDDMAEAVALALCPECVETYPCGPACVCQNLAKRAIRAVLDGIRLPRNPFDGPLTFGNLIERQNYRDVEKIFNRVLDARLNELDE